MSRMVRDREGAVIARRGALVDAREAYDNVTFVARLIVLAAVLASLVACGRPTRSASRNATPVERHVAPRFEQANGLPIRWEGRIASDPGAPPRFAWPASGFRVRFRGTGLVAKLEDRLLDDEIRDADLLAVYVDDRAPVTIELVEGTTDVTLASGLPLGDHLVRVLKRTESEQGTIVVHGFALHGRGAHFLEPPPARPHRLLAIGDSITAGYGIDGPDAHCHYSAGTSNATRTYAFFAAAELDAEYQAIAWSGRGLARNLRPSIPETIPVLYGRRLAAEEIPAEPSAFVPDAVVVNVGTNDYALPRPDRMRIFVAYRELLARIRADAPDAEIVVAVGPMLADDYPPGSMALTKMRRIASGVVAERRSRGDRKVSFVEFYGASPDESYGCDFHPSLATHRRLAAVLVEHLRPLLAR